MDIAINMTDGILVCAVSGEIDMYEAPEFHANYVAISAKKPECPIVIDLEKTSYIDSSGVGVLFQIFSDTKERNTKFCICNATGMVENLFNLSHMASILPLEKNLSCAIERVKNH